MRWTWKSPNDVEHLVIDGRCATCGRSHQFDPRWQKVTCKDCRRVYQCVPSDDYYGMGDETPTGPEDGLCWDCLMQANGTQDLVVVEVHPTDR